MRRPPAGAGSCRRRTAGRRPLAAAAGVGPTGPGPSRRYAVHPVAPSATPWPGGALPLPPRRCAGAAPRRHRAGARGGGRVHSSAPPPWPRPWPWPSGRCARPGRRVAAPCATTTSRGLAGCCPPWWGATPPRSHAAEIARAVGGVAGREHGRRRRGPRRLGRPGRRPGALGYRAVNTMDCHASATASPATPTTAGPAPGSTTGQPRPGPAHRRAGRRRAPPRGPRRLEGGAPNSAGPPVAQRRRGRGGLRRRAGSAAGRREHATAPCPSAARRWAAGGPAGADDIAAAPPASCRDVTYAPGGAAWSTVAGGWHETLRHPGAHGGDGARIARALGLDPDSVLDLSASPQPGRPRRRSSSPVPPRRAAPLPRRRRRARGSWPRPWGSSPSACC